MPSTVSRIPNGATNVPSRAPWGNVGIFDPTIWHSYTNDFDAYTSAGWTVTTVGTTPTAALQNGDGGLLLLSTTAGATDSIFLDKVGESFAITAGKRAAFKTRIQMSDATNSDILVGLQVTDTTPLDATDGIYFYKATGATSMSVFFRKDATTGSTSAVVGSMANATWVNLAWYFDGKSTLNYYLNDVQVGALSTTGFVPDTTMTISFGIKNGAAAIKTMTLDYIATAFER